MAELVLALNTGSSSIKFALFERGPEPVRRASGVIDGIRSGARLRVVDQLGTALADRSLSGVSYDELLEELLAWTQAYLTQDRLIAAGHRIVHGGDTFTGPCRLHEDAIVALERLGPLVPLHQQSALNAVRAVARLMPELAQYGSFDTAFHCTIEPALRRYGLPRNMEREGIRKYGFHGLSYDYVAERLKQLAPDSADSKIIVAHLGNGASLCALYGGQSVDTTMGFSALDGLVMGTRCGALDPGIILHLMRQGMSAAALEDLLYSRSGLLGVSEISSDMRTLLASPDPRAREAIDLFVSRIVREIGALAAMLGGLDGLVFTGGIGENAAEIRRLVSARLTWLGLSLDAAANMAHQPLISMSTSGVAAWVIPTDEELVIARQTISLLA